jgi:hypothetical protein
MMLLLWQILCKFLPLIYPATKDGFKNCVHDTKDFVGTTS